MPDFGGAIAMVVMWAFLGLIVAIPISQLLRMWSEGTIDGLLAIAVSASIMVLLAFTWQTAGTLWMLLFVALLLSLCIGVPLWSHYSGKRHLRQLGEDDIERCRRALDADPGNASAHALLGDAFMDKKSYVAAAAQYEKAIALARAAAVDNGRFDGGGHPAVQGWQRKLKRAVEAQSGPGAPVRVLVCDRCGTENAHDRKKCARCGQRLQLGFGQ